MALEHKRIALVTGAASGIGSAIARALAADGFSLILHSRRPIAVETVLGANPGEALSLAADLADETARAQLMAQALAATGGRLDLLVNNAGKSEVIPHEDLEAATPEIWHRLYEINTVAPWRLVALAEPALRRAAKASGRPAAVINISSHAGVRPKGASIPYAASKAALNHVTKLLAVTLAPAIRVNAVAPGLVDTPLTADWTTARDLWRERAPMRRGAEAQEIAALVAMLAAADYLTGEVILADGGLNLT